jgi:lipopolysaccharide heptosyltransferase II
MSGIPPYDRILLTRMKFIGDVVLTTPVIRSVRNAYPGAFIAYMGEREAVSLLEGNPCLDDIIPFDLSRPSVLEQTRIALLLRRRRFDLAIDLFGNPRSALVTRLSGARVRVGPDRKGRGRLYSIRVHDDGSPKSAIEFHTQALTAAGIPVSARTTELFPARAEREAVRLLLRHGDPFIDTARPLVGIHPGASWPAKHWLPERFAALADLLTERDGVQVLFTAGPRDADTIRAIRAHTGSRVRVVEHLSLRSLAALVSLCSAFVSNDAGPMHIAAAVGTPTIGLFGPGEENIWFPYDASSGHRALRADVPCHPCHLDFCNREGDGFMECMKLLTVGRVAAAVRGGLTSPRRG